MTETIKELEIKDIVANPYQPRQHFDDEKLEELAASMRENGILQPIIVRKSKVLGYELLAGERRFLAAQKAGLKKIPAIIREYSDQEMMTLSIIENLQRENLNPLEEAQSLKNLQDKSQLTHEEIAKIIGKSRSYVTNLIRILQLPQELLYLLEQRKITYGHARALLAVPDEIEQLELARLVSRKKLSVRELEKLVSTDKSTQAKPAQTDKNIFIESLEQDLKKTLGQTVKISANKNYLGQLSISFQNLEELENLIAKLEN